MKINMELTIVIPEPPSEFKFAGVEKSIKTEVFSKEELEQIGKEWTQKLVNKYSRPENKYH